MARFISLDAVSEDTEGSVLKLVGENNTAHSMQVILTGSPTAAIVQLQGALDPIDPTWFSIAEFSIAAGDATGAIKNVSACPVMALRAVLTGLTGGTSPTVTALVQTARV